VVIAVAAKLRTLVARAGLDRIALGAIGLLLLPVGLLGAFVPSTFFEEFPLGRGWLAVDGVYNEHLAGGVGSLYLSLVVATLFALRARPLVRPIAAGWLVQGILHIGYHFRYLHLYDAPIDKIGVIVTLLAVPILAAIALVANAAESFGRVPPRPA
jgi:hypothetical protein